jgi:tetraacyldisaccharide 4'-kinase
VRRPWLAPLVPLYAAGAAVRARMQTQRRLQWPVVSVGNLSTGGAGKTPFTIALARLLTERGFAVDVLSRGYGRRSSVAAKVEVEGRAQQFGDEPLLIARATELPVYVAAQRYEAGMLAEGTLQEPAEASLRHGFRAHILDDGFQHRQLKRDVDILLLRESDLNDVLLPAGNLREKLSATSRATVVVVDADEPGVESFLRETISIDSGTEGERWQGPVWRVRRRMEVPAVDGPVLAFCGIARPEQFFAGLEAAGVTIADQMAFRDHHAYRQADLNDLMDRATLPAKEISALVTTEKDAIRLADAAFMDSLHLPLKTVGLRVEICDEAAAMDWLTERLRAAAAQHPL